MNAHLIDDVARRMTDLAPPADLRTRVMAQLADRPATWRVWAPTIASAAVLALVAGLSVARRPPSENIVAVPAPVTEALVSETGLASLAPATIASAKARKTRSRTHEMISAVEAAWRARAIPAIAVAEPLTAGDIQPESLSLPLLELKPLVTTPVIVAPIAAADASGGR